MDSIDDLGSSQLLKDLESSRILSRIYDPHKDLGSSSILSRIYDPLEYLDPLKDLTFSQGSSLDKLVNRHATASIQ